VIAAPNSAEQLRTLAGYGLGLVTAYFFVASLVLRWRPRQGVQVAKYEPPAGVSPAAAAYLLERGVGDKPFVVALVNMAAKGYLRIEQGSNDYLLSCANQARTHACIPLETEEQLIAEMVFSHGVSSVLLSALHTLEKIARNVRESLEAAAEPDLLSPHFSCFIPGLTVSLWCFLAALYPEMAGLSKSNGGALIVLPAFLAVWALLATIRTLPATLYKLKSFFPSRTPRPMRWVKTDRIAPFMFLVAVACLGVIGWATSWQFALLFGSFITVNLVGLMALRSPTAAGHALLGQLADFRLFFAAVDSDRVNRMNSPNAPSATAEKYWAWALALDVEHAWGEQFAATVLNRLGPESAMASIENNCPEERRASSDIVDLHLR
jgi:hypothetical protein